jgi:DNA topoisomerase-1
MLELDFLGKDSMRYHNIVDLGRFGEAGRLVHKNFKSFAKGKPQNADIFDVLTPSLLNDELKKYMAGLSAKVFRTYNASITLERQLEEMDPGVAESEKYSEYLRANREVAILCNHQKTVSAKSEEGIQKLREKAELYKRQLDELKAMLAKVKAGKEDGIRLRSSDAKIQSRAEEAAKKIKKDREDEEAAKYGGAAGGAGAGAGAGAAASSSSSSSSSSAAAAAAAAEKAAAQDEKDLKACLRTLKDGEAHLWTKAPDRKSVEARIAVWEEKLEKQTAEVRDRDDNKTVALSTSKINYMDPRITVAWCKRVELRIEKPFEVALRNKFPWAMQALSTFKFHPNPELEARERAEAIAQAKRSAAIAAGAAASSSSSSSSSAAAPAAAGAGAGAGAGAFAAAVASSAGAAAARSPA